MHFLVLYMHHQRISSRLLCEVKLCGFSFFLDACISKRNSPLKTQTMGAEFFGMSKYLFIGFKFAVWFEGLITHVLPCPGLISLSRKIPIRRDSHRVVWGGSQDRDSRDSDVYLLCLPYCNDTCAVSRSSPPCTEWLRDMNYMADASRMQQ